jgi:hypothetical protein
MLVAEYSAGTVGSYTIDANGNPVLASRHDFITGLTGAEGAAIDPLTGDFFFSTFGSGNQVFQVRGFTAPPPPSSIPEPSTWLLFSGGLLILVSQRRKLRHSA